MSVGLLLLLNSSAPVAQTATSPTCHPAIAGSAPDLARRPHQGFGMPDRTDTSIVLAETVRAACLDAASLAYEDAGIRGLCAEGRWEAAVTAIRQLDLARVLENHEARKDAR